jgi:hypothetical protein
LNLANQLLDGIRRFGPTADGEADTHGRGHRQNQQREVMIKKDKKTVVHCLDLSCHQPVLIVVETMIIAPRKRRMGLFDEA